MKMRTMQCITRMVPICSVDPWRYRLHPVIEKLHHKCDIVEDLHLDEVVSPEVVQGRAALDELHLHVIVIVIVAVIGVNANIVAVIVIEIVAVPALLVYLAANLHHLHAEVQVLVLNVAQPVSPSLDPHPSPNRGRSPSHLSSVYLLVTA